jgi:hypothetical protein
MFHFYCGLDLGQSSDYTALALVEEAVWLGREVNWEHYGVFLPGGKVPDGSEGWTPPSALAPRYARQAQAVNYYFGRPPHPPLYVRHLQRYELGTKYTAIIEDVKRLLLTPPIRQRLDRTRLLVDKTGVGAAVVDAFQAAGVQPISVTIHGGDKVLFEDWGFSCRVPKRDLVSAVQVPLQNGRLRIAEGLTLADTLRRELLNFRVKIDPKTAHDSYSHWREADHDDLVLSVALACWYREYINRNLEARNAEAQAGGAAM